jgi:uncharacterized Tic20 family protein
MIAFINIFWITSWFAFAVYIFVYAIIILVRAYDDEY